MHAVQGWATPRIMQDKRFPTIKTDSLEWVFVTKNGSNEINELRRKYHFHPLDLKDIQPPIQRPKVVARDGYIFMILLYPFFDRKTRVIKTTEVDFFISQDRIVTVNTDAYPPLKDLFDACRTNGPERQVCVSGDVSQTLYAILNNMLVSEFPMLVHINADLDDVDGKLFNGFEKNLIEELLRIKTNVVNVRKVMQGHGAVIRRLISIAPGYFHINKLRDYFDELMDHTKEIWETLEIQKDTVDAIHETNTSLINFRTNEVMKTLTIFSVIILPLTLITTLFGFILPQPLSSHPGSLLLIIGLMAVTALGMLGYFKYRKWL
jgi:magnesium transporter